MLSYFILIYLNLFYFNLLLFLYYHCQEFRDRAVQLAQEKNKENINTRDSYLGDSDPSTFVTLSKTVTRIGSNSSVEIEYSNMNSDRRSRSSFRAEEKDRCSPLNSSSPGRAGHTLLTTGEVSIMSDSKSDRGSQDYRTGRFSFIEDHRDNDIDQVNMEMAGGKTPSRSPRSFISPSDNNIDDVNMDVLQSKGIPNGSEARLKVLKSPERRSSFKESGSVVEVTHTAVNGSANANANANANMNANMNGSFHELHIEGNGSPVGRREEENGVNSGTPQAQVHMMSARSGMYVCLIISVFR